MATTKVTKGVIADNAVGIDQLDVTDGSNGQVLSTNGSGTLSFSDIPAGYTDSDARSAISVSGDLSYDSSTGVISYSDSDTTYTDSDARGAISGGTGISYDSSTGVITNTVSNTDTTYSAGTGLSLSGTTFSSTITQYADSDVESYLDGGTSTPTFSSATVTGDATFDTDTLVIDSTNNRVGIGTASPAYQVEIENTGANALLVLDRTDGAACFIEGQATRSAFGSVGATPLALAYNSAAVVEIGASGAITVNPDGDGFTFPTSDGTANQVLSTDGSGTLSFSTVSVSQTLTVIGRSSNTNISITSGTLAVEGRSGNINIGV